MKTLTLHQPWAQLMVTRAPWECDTPDCSCRGERGDHTASGGLAMVKWIETRSWRAPESLIGQHVAIHGAARTTVTLHDAERAWRAAGCDLDDYIATRWRERNISARPLPLGAVVGSGVLTACLPIETPESEVARGERIVWTSGAGDLKIARFVRMRERMAEMGMPAGTDDPVLQALGAMPLHDAHPWVEEADVRDQLPFGYFEPGRWAWLFADLAPTTERCPACWGTGERLEANGLRVVCVCGDAGRCEPIPARGMQRVWNWHPER